MASYHIFRVSARNLKSKYGIYKLIDDEGRIYIGSSANLKNRLSEHYRDIKRGSHHNINIKESSSIFRYEIIEYLYFPINYSRKYIKEHLLCRELYYINLLGKDNILLNVSKDTGGSKLGHKMSEDRKADMRVNPVYINALIKAREVGRKSSIEAKLGIPRSLETKIKISFSRRNSKKLRFVHIYDLNENLIKAVLFVKDAHEFTGVSMSAIKNNLYGLSKRCTDYIFKFSDKQ